MQSRASRSALAARLLAPLAIAACAGTHRGVPHDPGAVPLLLQGQDRLQTPIAEGSVVDLCVSETSEAGERWQRRVALVGVRPAERTLRYEDAAGDVTATALAEVLQIQPVRPNTGIYVAIGGTLATLAVGALAGYAYMNSELERTDDTPLSLIFVSSLIASLVGNGIYFSVATGVEMATREMPMYTLDSGEFAVVLPSANSPAQPLP